MIPVHLDAGRVIKDFPRDKIKITSPSGAPSSRPRARCSKDLRMDRPAGLQCEGSLKRMGVDYIGHVHASEAHCQG